MKPAWRRALASAAIVLLVAGGLLWSFWPRPIAVDMAPVTRGPMSVEVVDEGRTRVREIYQVSAPVMGQLLRVDVHAGDEVKGGVTRVAELLPSSPGFNDVRTRTQVESMVQSADAARSLAAAEVVRAKARLAYAAADLGRATTLVKSSVISRADFERTQLAHATAVAELATADANLRAKQSDLDAARALLIDPTAVSGQRRHRAGIPIVAPVSGRVLRVLHESESVMAAGAPILEIGDPSDIEIVADFISEDAVKIHAGDPAVITDWGGPRVLHARVRRVEPSGFTKISSLGVEEQRVNVLLDFVGRVGDAAPIADGFRVIVHVVVWQQADVLRVPITAMFRRGSGWAVFVVRDGRAKLTPVDAGMANDEVAQVLKGLQQGDKVILHPSDRVEDGASVAAQGNASSP